MAMLIRNRRIRDLFVSVITLCLCFGISILLQDVFQIPEQVTTAFAFAVFLVSLLTDGYWWGIGASVASILLVNYAFTPIIVLSARSDEAEKVRALDLGANDYITKPFSAAEFLARVRSVLRFSQHRAEEGRLSGGCFQLRELRIEYDSRRVFIGDTEIKLTQTEYNILAYLSEYSGKVMTYSAIVKAIWGHSSVGGVKRLQVNMANIRRKLGIKPGENNYIVNELGVGYRMNSD